MITAAKFASYRQAFLYTALGWGMLVTLFTELLSIFDGVTSTSLIISWGSVTLLAACYLFTKQCHKNLPPITIASFPALICILIIVIITLLLGVISPPTTWDSMTYHMGRVVHWIQNQSVAHYPTNIIRQIYFPPWAEFAIMHLQILSNGDYLANLVQWFSMCGSLVGVSLLAQQLGASPSRQLFAAVITATIPMGILQSSSSQNDYVAAFWLVCFVYFGMRLRNELAPALAVPTGAALGLAILTKGTAYIYALPFVLWFLAAGMTEFRKAVKCVVITASIALALNSGHYLRNIGLWGNPLAADIDHVQTTRKDLPATLSNLSRNLAANTWTTSESLNSFQFNAIAGLHTLLGIEASAPETSLGASFAPSTLSLHEDTAGNGLHTILILSSLPLLIFGVRSRIPSSARLYSIALLSSIILFCLLLKWSPWTTRLQLSGFVLFSPLVAIAMPGVYRPWVTRTTIIILIISSIPWLFYNQSRPLLGEWSIIGAERNALYFVNNPGLLDYYNQAATLIVSRTDCRAIGIYGDLDAYEYPLWALVKSRSNNMPRIEHINIENITNIIPRKDFAPCLSIELFQTL